MTTTDCRFEIVVLTVGAVCFVLFFACWVIWMVQEVFAYVG